MRGFLLSVVCAVVVVALSAGESQARLFGGGRSMACNATTKRVEDVKQANREDVTAIPAAKTVKVFAPAPVDAPQLAKKSRSGVNMKALAAQMHSAPAEGVPVMSQVAAK